MSSGLRLGEYAATPLYNIKAVVQATGISPSTLRAWERRYNIARPQRSESGYRLYAERDVAVIRWLKAQVDAGMSISQAVTWLDNIVTSAGKMEQATLPTSGSGATRHDPLESSPAAPPTTKPVTHHEMVRDLSTLQQELIRGLAAFDEDRAEAIVSEAYSLFSVEEVGEKLFLPVLQEIDARQERGDLSLTTAHFASTYLSQRLGSILRFTPNVTSGPLVWVARPRAEPHAVNALLLSISLRRAGYHMHYLGQNLPTEERAIQDFIHEAERHHPAVVIFTVNTPHAAQELDHLSTRLSQIVPQPFVLGYGGTLFSHRPELHRSIAGTYLGVTTAEIVRNVRETLAKTDH